VPQGTRRSLRGTRRALRSAHAESDGAASSRQDSSPRGHPCKHCRDPHPARPSRADDKGPQRPSPHLAFNGSTELPISSRRRSVLTIRQARSARSGHSVALARVPVSSVCRPAYSLGLARERPAASGSEEEGPGRGAGHLWPRFAAVSRAANTFSQQASCGPNTSDSGKQLHVSRFGSTFWRERDATLGGRGAMSEFA
jgi:hypothetical protein